MMRKPLHNPQKHRQEGVTLVIALIMLVLLTLLVVTSLNLGRSSMQAAGNMQHRNEATNAAKEVLEEVISSKRFFEVPTDVFGTPCVNKPNTRCVDINADGKNDVEVTITPAPSCLQAQSVKTASLNLQITEDFGCMIGTQQNFGVGMPGSSSGDSLCANTLWDLRAEATDAVTETKAVLTHGIDVRVSTDNMLLSCP